MGTLVLAVDGDALLSVVAASFLAGVGVPTIFSMVILASTRSAELRRSGNSVVAALVGIAAVLGVLCCVAAVTFGIQLMASK